MPSDRAALEDPSTLLLGNPRQSAQVIGLRGLTPGPHLDFDDDHEETYTRRLDFWPELSDNIRTLDGGSELKSPQF